MIILILKMSSNISRFQHILFKPQYPICYQDDLDSKEINIWPHFTQDFTKQIDSKIQKLFQERTSPITQQSAKNVIHITNQYERNVVANIGRRFFAALVSDKYHKQILHICQKQSLSYEEIIGEFRTIKSPTKHFGVTRLHQLCTISYQNPLQKAAQRVMIIFFTWFCRNRCVIQFMREGRMDQKRIYINFKNRLLYLMDHQL